jgi:hypothetical protein
VEVLGGNRHYGPGDCGQGLRHRRRDLRAAIREQVGSIVKRLHRSHEIENIGAGRANKWKLADA